MPSATKVLLAVLCISLSGCGSWFDNANSTVGAEPLISIATLMNPQDGYQPDSSLNLQGNYLAMYYLGEVLIDSETKCNNFLSRLTNGENTSDAFFDTTSVTAGALGAVFTPIATIHLLSATSAIATGTRSAFSNDFYGNASVANFAQAIETQYYAGIDSYITYLNTAYANNSPINLPGEIARINSIHAQCALGPAEATINAALKNAGGSQNAATSTTTTFQVTNPVADDDHFDIKATTTLDASFTAGKSDSAASVVSGLQNAINGNPNFKAAGVSASDDLSNGGFKLIISAPTSADLTWVATTDSKTAKFSQVVPTAPTPSAPVAAGGGAAQPAAVAPAGGSAPSSIPTPQPPNFVPGTVNNP